MGLVRVPLDLRTPRVSTLAGNAFWTVVGLTDWDAARWEFVPAVDGKLYGVVQIPQSLAAAPAPAIGLAVAANAAAGVTRISVATLPVADTESFNPAALIDEAAQDVVVPGTAYLRKDVTFALTPGIVAGDLLLVEVFHEGAHVNDTLAVNTLLFDAWLQVTLT